jgi:WD40 repeat protein
MAQGNEDTIDSVSFSSDGKRLAGGNDQVVIIWEVSTGKILHRCKGHEKSISSVAFAPRAEVLASAGDGVCLWNAGTGKLLRRLGKREDVQSLVYSPDGKTLAFSSDESGTVMLFDVATNKERGRLLGNKFGLRCLSFSPDSTTLASGGDEGSVCLWDVASGKKRKLLGDDQRYAVRAMAFSPDGRILAVQGWGQTILRWDVDTGKLCRPFDAHDGEIFDVAFSADGQSLLTAGFDGELRAWNATTGKGINSVWRSDWGRCRGFHPGGKITVIEKDDIRLRDVCTGKELARFSQAATLGNCFALSPDFKLMATGDAAYTNHVWQRGNETEQRQFKIDETHYRFLMARGEGVTSQVFCHDGRTLVSAGTGMTIWLWDTATGKITGALCGHNGRVNCLALSPCGRLLASGDSQWEVRLWDLEMRRQVAELGPFEQGQVCSVAFSADGRTLAAGDEHGEIRLWEVVTGRERRRFKGHQGGVNQLTFASDGRRLASGSSDTTALIWDLAGLTANKHHQSRAHATEDLDALWRTLASSDATDAYQAAWDLTTASARTVRFLGSRLQRAPSATQENITRMVGDLNNDRFTVRQKAQGELARLGELTRPALLYMLTSKPSLEVRQRIDSLLANLDPRKSSDCLRTLRALEVLENIGTSEAQQLLEHLATGAPQARLTREAQAALARVTKRP